MSACGTIYDTIRSELPLRSYTTEVDSYLEWRCRRGFLQSVLPVSCYGAMAGFVIGFRQSFVEGRYIGRYRVIGRYTSTFAAVGLLVSAIHQYMIVRNDYNDAFYYPIIAGTMGSVVLTIVSQMGTIGRGMLVGGFVGTLYTIGCYGVKHYHKRYLNIFFREQQLHQVSVHKVSPELQPLYRAYLFENRPLEESDKFRREALLLSRGDDDMRLDAYSVMQHMTPEIFDWVNFPDWWPLKWPVQTEEEQMLLERKRADEIERRKLKFLDSEDGVLLKRLNRSKRNRDV